MKKTIKLKDTQSDQVLYSFTIEELQNAYDKALELENYGVDVSLEIPSLPETLLHSLGAKSEDLFKLKKEINSEIESHGESCCYKVENS